MSRDFADVRSADLVVNFDWLNSVSFVLTTSSLQISRYGLFYVQDELFYVQDELFQANLPVTFLRGPRKLIV